MDEPVEDQSCPPGDGDQEEPINNGDKPPAPSKPSRSRVSSLAANFEQVAIGRPSLSRQPSTFYEDVDDGDTLTVPDTSPPPPTTPTRIGHVAKLAESFEVRLREGESIFYHGLAPEASADPSQTDQPKTKKRSSVVLISTLGSSNASERRRLRQQSLPPSHKSLHETSKWYTNRLRPPLAEATGDVSSGDCDGDSMTSTELVDTGDDVGQIDIVLSPSPDHPRRPGAALVRRKSSTKSQGAVSMADSDTTFGNESTRSSLTSLNSNLSLLMPAHNGTLVTPATSTEDLSEEGRLAKAKRKLYMIAKELVTTEEKYVDVLKLLNNDYRAVAKEYLPDDIIDNQLLPHIPQLLLLNEQLLTELHNRLDQYEQDEVIMDVLKKMGPFLKQYSLYMKDHHQISNAHTEMSRRYPSYATALKQFEAHERCRRLTVQHYLLEPIQRIPRYELLLKDYLKHLPPGHVDFRNADDALRIITGVNSHANNTVREGLGFERLYEIQQSLLIPKELVQPGRVLLKDGTLIKLSRKEEQERLFVLCSDCLIYLTEVQGTYRLNHELSLTGMRVAKNANPDFENEIHISSPQRSLIVLTKDRKERDEWYQAIASAINNHTSRRRTFEKDANGGSRSRPASMISCDSNTSADDRMTLGEVAPLWIPDARVTMCQVCTAEFTVTFRRHHCRCCGKVVCKSCSANKAPLKYRNYKAERVCDECYEVLRKQLESIRPDNHKTPTAPLSRAESRTSESNFNSFIDIEKLEMSFEMPDTADVKYEHLNTLFQRNESARGSTNKRIVSKVLKVPANATDSTIAGYLHLRKSKKNWIHQWFIIHAKVLYSYRASEDAAALTSTPLLGWQVSLVDNPVDSHAVAHLLQLSHPGQSNLIFRVDNPALRDKWYQAMDKATKLED